MVMKMGPPFVQGEKNSTNINCIFYAIKNSDVLRGKGVAGRK